MATAHEIAEEGFPTVLALKITPEKNKRIEQPKIDSEPDIEIDSRQAFLGEAYNQDQGAIGGRDLAFLGKKSEIVLFFNMNLYC